MPIYFAYGANMDVAAMARRCPASKPLGPARLMGHLFFITRDGYASVRRSPGAVVHGLLWDLALADVAALDRYEEVAGGLYAKIQRPVIKPSGSVRALLYVACSLEEGVPRPGYLEAVIAAATSLACPATYLRDMARYLPGGRLSAAEPQSSQPGPVAGVTPRFVTPFDRT